MSDKKTFEDGTAESIASHLRVAADQYRRNIAVLKEMAKDQNPDQMSTSSCERLARQFQVQVRDAEALASDFEQATTVIIEAIE